MDVIIIISIIVQYTNFKFDIFLIKLGYLYDIKFKIINNMINPTANLF
mgnify:FL=1